MLYRNLSGLENLEYFSALGGASYTRAELIEFFGQVGLLTEAAENRVSTYSKGMRQKVGIAVAIAKNAKALLLDEPTSGLDPKAANEFSELLKKMSDAGVAVLMATHDLFRAKESGTRVGIMKHGKLVDILDTDTINHTDIERIYLEHMHD
jgi:ABC-2 type transport system ATP-binding protein